MRRQLTTPGLYFAPAVHCTEAGSMPGALPWRCPSQHSLDGPWGLPAPAPVPSTAPAPLPRCPGLGSGGHHGPRAQAAAQVHATPPGHTAVRKHTPRQDTGLGCARLGGWGRLCPPSALGAGLPWPALCLAGPWWSQQQPACPWSRGGLASVEQLPLHAPDAGVHAARCGHCYAGDTESRSPRAMWSEQSARQVMKETVSTSCGSGPSGGCQNRGWLAAPPPPPGTDPISQHAVHGGSARWQAGATWPRGRGQGRLAATVVGETEAGALPEDAQLTGARKRTRESGPSATGSNPGRPAAPRSPRAPPTPPRRVHSCPRAPPRHRSGSEPISAGGVPLPPGCGLGDSPSAG